MPATTCATCQRRRAAPHKYNSHNFHPDIVGVPSGDGAALGALCAALICHLRIGSAQAAAAEALFGVQLRNNARTIFITMTFESCT